MSNHTKGPWRSYEHRGAVEIVDADKRYLATFHGGLGSQDIFSEDERDANVRLFLNAPQMLGALRMAEHYLKMTKTTSQRQLRRKQAALQALAEVLSDVDPQATP